MKEKKISKKRVLLPGGIFLFCITAGLVFLFWFGYRVHHIPSDKIRNADIEALSRGDYEAVMLSMYTPEAFSAEEFEHFRGIPTVQAFHPFVNLADIGNYLEQSFFGNNNLSHVYIGLDPFVISGLYGHHASLYAKDYARYLTEYVEAHDDVLFELLIPAYSLSYLKTLSDSTYTELIDSYRNLVNIYIPYGNVYVYFLGHEEWLIANSGNYAGSTCLTSSILRLVAAYSIANDRYILKPDNMEERFEQMTDLVRETDISYPDLAEWCIVFIGDSIFEYNAGSRSVSGVVENLSGAQVYNCSKGGIAAAEDPEEILSFNRMVTRFLEQDTSGLDDSMNFKLELQKYIRESHEGRKYCFALNFGLNDYATGTPIENPADGFDVNTYSGAMRTGISRLKEAYPEAVILLQTPTYAIGFSEGTEILGEGGGTITDYVKAAISVAQDMDVLCINNYDDSGINADTYEKYLADGCHPNETGAFLLGRRILEVMEGLVGNDVQADKGD